MGKTTKGRRAAETSNVGKGKVTPVQVAFIVDRYLADNNFSETRSAFRSEASSLLAKSSLNEAPKSLLSLGAMLDEYIRLKEQKVILDQEKCRVEQEKLRVQTLLQGMQDVMNAYNSGVTTSAAVTPPPPPPVPAAAIVPSSAGYPAYRTPVMTSVSMTQSVKVDHSNLSTPIISSRPPRKRKIYKGALEAPTVPKKLSGPLPNNQLLNKGGDSVVQSNNASNGDHMKQPSPCPESSVPNYAHEGSPIQGSSVAKNLFNKPSQSPTSNSSGPKTPPRAASSQSDKSISPLEEVSSTAKSHHNDTLMETTPTNCTIISSKTIIVSPAKHFSIERNHCTFSSPMKRQNKREHVKGRLDFDGSDMPTCLDNTVVSGDGSSTSESEKEGDIFDLDFDYAFGPDFSLSEFLTDFGIDCATLDCSCPTTSGAHIDAIPTALCETNGEFGTSQELLEHSSSMTEVFAGDMSQNGGDSMTAVKSITKCIRIVSPSKSSRNSSVNDQENTSERS